MRTTAIAHTWRRCLAWSAVSRTARLSIFGFTGWFGLLSADDSAWKAVPLVAVLGLSVLVGLAWYVSRARADRRWRGALDRYAERELAKETLHRGGIEDEGDGHERHR